MTDGTLTKNHLRPHCYTNAAPKQIEGNVFRYDFDEQVDAPVVDRTKKPKGEVGAAEVVVAVKTPKPPPNVNRNLKPTTPKVRGEFLCLLEGFFFKYFFFVFLQNSLIQIQ